MSLALNVLQPHYSIQNSRDMLYILNIVCTHSLYIGDRSNIFDIFYENVNYVHCHYVAKLTVYTQYTLLNQLHRKHITQSSYVRQNVVFILRQNEEVQLHV